MPTESTDRSDRAKVEQWLKDNPEAAHEIAKWAVWDLYFPGGCETTTIVTGDVDGLDDVDYRCSMFDTLDHAGILPVLQEMQSSQRYKND